MKRKFHTRYLTLLGIFILSACSNNSTSVPCNEIDYHGWDLNQSVSKIIQNIDFEFPVTGSAFKHQDRLVELTLKAVDENCKLLNMSDYATPFSVRFLSTRDAMEKHSGIPASGAANALTKEVHMLFPDSIETIPEGPFTVCPLKHELMHMISQTSWGYPNDNLTWLDEGLATYAENNCSGLNVAELYRYFLENDMLISMDSLTTDFYNAEDMIAYHQSGYIAQYLIENYGLQKFKLFWQEDFTAFEDIFGLAYSEMEMALNTQIKKAYPTSPDLNWESFKLGCN